MFQMESIKRIIKLMPLASKDETRYHLTGVAVSRNDGTSVLLEVTDGHKMVRETINCDVLPGLLGDKKIIIFRDQLAGLKNANVFTSINWESKLILYPGGAVAFDDQAQYPNTKQLEPNEKDLTHKIGFNAQYIIDLAKALTMAHKDQETHSRGWNIGVRVVSMPDLKCKELDSFEIYLTYGSNGGLPDQFLGTVVQVASGPKFIKGKK